MNENTCFVLTYTEISYNKESPIISSTRHSVYQNINGLYNNVAEMLVNTNYQIISLVKVDTINLIVRKYKISISESHRLTLEELE